MAEAVCYFFANDFVLVGAKSLYGWIGAYYLFNLDFGVKAKATGSSVIWAGTGASCLAAARSLSATLVRLASSYPSGVDLRSKSGVTTP